MHTFTDARTHSNQGVHAEKGYFAHANDNTQGHTYLCRTLQEGDHMFKVRYTCMHVLMNTHMHTQHILTKVLDSKREEWDTHTGPNSSKQFACNYAKGVDHMWEVRWACIVHILIVLYQACI